MQVELLTWPEAEVRRRELAALGRPCLLLVSASATPPDIRSRLEDWIRVPASEQDVAARIHRLRQLVLPEPMAHLTIDDDDVLHVDDRWVALSRGQAAIARALAFAAPRLVLRPALASAAGVDAESRALDSIVHRLRGRLAPLGIDIVGVRGRGYALTPAEAEILGG
jgi:DNA-binding response OmpR family regulator